MFKGQELWFYDDNENLVQATLNETLLSSGYVGLRKNLDDYVFFKLYTREVKEGYQSLYIDDEFTFSRSNFDSKRPTKFVTHGWMNSYESPACTLIRDGKNFFIIIIIKKGVQTRTKTNNYWGGLCKKF